MSAAMHDGGRTAIGVHRWMLVAGLYVTQGIPLGLAMEALPALLRRQGAALDSLAFLPMVGVPWVLKFLWASQVDNRWSARLGRRRSWILPMQALVLLCLIGAAWTGVSDATALGVVALAAAGSFASATQDIATDGLTAENFKGAALARANALQVGGTMVGFFFGGSGCLMLTGALGVQGALAVLALPVALSWLLALAWEERGPEAMEPAAARRVQPARLRHFIARPGAWPMMAAAALSAMTAVAGYGLSKLMLVDAGWALEDVGRLGMAGGGITVLLGCGGGAWLAGRIGARKLFVIGLGASACACGLWLDLSLRSPGLPPPGVWLATALGCFGAGAASVAVMTLAMAFAARGVQAGTDMTAMQSARDVGEIVTSSSLTGLAAVAGYAGSFAAGLLVALAGLVLAWRLRRQDDA
ncbi:RhtX/FptX family siderophore transporter [Paracidovorax avenae]